MAETKQEEVDFAEAVLGLRQQVEQLGYGLEELMQHSPEEKARIDRAKNAITTAKQELADAGNISMKWFRGGTRVANREREARVKITGAEREMTRVEEQVAKDVRERLVNASLEESQQAIFTAQKKIISIITRRREQIENQLGKIRGRKNDVTQTKEKAAGDLERLKGELSKKEAELRREELDLEGMTHGSVEFSKQEETLSDLRAEVEEVRANRNTALAEFQSAEIFAKSHAQFEVALLNQREVQTMWITILETELPERMAQCEARLEAQKAASDAEIAKTIDQIGTEVDQRNVEKVVALGTAAVRDMLDRTEAQPDRVLNIIKVGDLQNEATVRALQRMDKSIANWEENYGLSNIDLAGSYFTRLDRENEPTESTG